MKFVYADNGATAFPKAPGVSEAMVEYLEKVGGNINRGAHRAAFSAENIVYETRELLGELFNFPLTENIVFTKNVTESLNLVILGLLQPGDHIITSSVEHNAVMRPLNSFGGNVTYSRLNIDAYGNYSLQELETLLQKNTKAVIITQASNVSGSVSDLIPIGEFCQKHDLFFIVDTAQTAGFWTGDFADLKADSLCFTGHKSLLGPQGIGGLTISTRLDQNMKSLIYGGTGSMSEEEIQPHYLPDKYEAGTANIPGIYGLNAALKFLKREGLQKIHEKEMALTKLFLEGVRKLPGAKLIGRNDTVSRCPLVSLDFPDHDNGIVAHHLSQDYGIMTRSGLHCAPAGHKSFNTFPRGTVRFAFNLFNTPEEIEYILSTVQQILKS